VKRKEELLKSFAQLGKLMQLHASQSPWPGYESGVTEAEYQHFEKQMLQQTYKNGWFTLDIIRQSLGNLSNWLTETQLRDWSAAYHFSETPKTVAIIMAGNIPLVGFHDFLCVLMSGHRAMIKLSSDDDLLLPLLVHYLEHFYPEINTFVSFEKGALRNFDAVIATGSNNSLLHFQAYFDKYPNLLRHNRTSVAVLNGSESKEEMTLLGKDIFTYFGRGCRNVTHLIVPENYDFATFFESIVVFGDVVNNKKYGNNYDYNKSIHLMNLEKFLDNNFVLLKESESLHAPLSMLYFHSYQNDAEIADYLEKYRSDIQCVVGKNYLPFGAAQCPSLIDYADDVDTMQWLNAFQ